MGFGFWDMGFGTKDLDLGLTILMIPETGFTEPIYEQGDSCSDCGYYDGLIQLAVFKKHLSNSPINVMLNKLAQ